MIGQAGAFWVLAALSVQGVAMALRAISSGFDDHAVLRVSGVTGVVAVIVMVSFGVPVLTALGVAAGGPILAVLLGFNFHRRHLLSFGPYADLMESHGCHTFLNAKQSERGRKDGSMLRVILIGERFEPATPGSDELSGEYVASTIVLDGELCDVNLPGIIGWMPREPWMAVLTEEELGAIRFAMRPAPPIEELLAAKLRGEFLIHDAFGEANLRGYLVANHPDLLVDPLLHSDAECNPLQDSIEKTEKVQALKWAWVLVAAGVVPLVLSWVVFAGSIVGGGGVG